jgi:hypothetical protein
MNIVAFVKEHPLEIGIGLVGGIILIRMFGGSSGAATDTGQAAAQSAYFAAQSAEAQSGNALQAVQIQTQAETAQALIGSNASIVNNTTWANAQMHSDDNAVTISGINADAQVKIAPYAVENSLISALGLTAQKPGSVVTSSSSDSGFFGIGASSSTSSQYVADPAAVQAQNALGNLVGSMFGSGTNTGNGFHPAHG